MTAIVRIPGALGALERVIALFALSGVCAGAFLIGRSHARRRQEEKQDES